MNRGNEYPLVLMCTPIVVKELQKRLPLYYECISPTDVIVVGNKEVGRYIVSNSINVRFIDEDEVYKGLTYKAVEEFLLGKKNDELVKKRTGWYFQQFLKYAIAFRISYEDYLVWDADTIPTKHIQMMIDDKRVMHTGTMVYKAYEQCFYRLFPNLSYAENVSFITEHMLLNSKVVKELINQIESNDKLRGKSFYEKIIDSIDISELSKSGYSEFETYGNYIQNVYPDMYKCKEWKTLRAGTAFFSGENNKDILFLSNYVDAVSFEKHKKHVRLSKVLRIRGLNRLLAIMYLRMIYH